MKYSFVANGVEIYYGITINIALTSHESDMATTGTLQLQNSNL